ncbi:MAG: OmpA family protein [Pyrinomonadaceae bacterium]|nr:OmpA family protein [Sphingobacteriaceae bacterium]
MVRIVCGIALVFQSLLSSAQVKNPGDLDGAKTITLNKPYRFEKSPKGFGAIQEFSKDFSRSPFLFEEERNTIWLLLEIPFSGLLTFEIAPHKALDDYDWMLFNYTSDFKTLLRGGKTKLLRSNNSRNDKAIGGKTGLKENYSNLYEKPGLGKSYSKSLAVNKGQKLALLIDNIYDLGAGFDFITSLKPEITAYRTLTGIIKDKNTRLPLAAKIACEDDSTGIELTSTVAKADGTYSILIPVNRRVDVTANFPEYVFQTTGINPDKKNAELNFNLSQTKEIEKLVLFNIRFTPDRDLIRPNSEPELERLITLLQQEKGWDIRIIGHTNNNPFADGRYLQKLSFNRALSVKKYLMERGISEKRISCAGMGGKSPFIVTRDIEESLKNLRVEIVVSRK